MQRQDPRIERQLAAEAEDDVRASEDFIQRRLSYPDPHGVIEKQREYAEERRRDAQRHRRAACEISRELITTPRTLTRSARPRGAGRPRAAATRSSSRSGDSGDDGPSGEPPAPPAPADAAGAPPLKPPARQTLRAVRANVLYDLLANRPPKVMLGELLGTIRGSLGWSDATTRTAVGDLLIDGRAQVDIWGRVEVVA